MTTLFEVFVILYLQDSLKIDIIDEYKTQPKNVC